MNIRILSRGRQLINTRHGRTHGIREAIKDSLSYLRTGTLFNRAPGRALTVLTIGNLLVIGGLMNTLTAQDSQHISTTVLLCPDLSSHGLLNGLTIKRLIILDTLLDLFTILTLSLGGLDLLLLGLKRHR